MKRLYQFLAACGGSWRNSIFLSCREPASGYLLSFDRDSRPVLLSVDEFSRITGEQIDPAECCGRLTEAAFRTAFSQYLLWRVPEGGGDVLAELCQFG